MNKSSFRLVEIWMLLLFFFVFVFIRAYAIFFIYTCIYILVYTAVVRKSYRSRAIFYISTFYVCQRILKYFEVKESDNIWYVCIRKGTQRERNREREKERNENYILWWVFPGLENVVTRLKFVFERTAKLVAKKKEKKKKNAKT